MIYGIRGKFKCKYWPRGCTTKETWRKIRRHERSCSYGKKMDKAWEEKRKSRWM